MSSSLDSQVGLYLYWDANAGLPLGSSSQQWLKKFSEDPLLFGTNPSSRHQLGQRARARLLEARDRVGASLGIERGQGSEIIFTASGTESIQSILSFFLRAVKAPSLIATSQIEHPAVGAYFSAHGVSTQIQWIGVTPTGRLDLDQLDAVLAKGVRYLSLQWVNNETGVIQPLDEIVERLRPYPDVCFHLDAAQAWGKLPIDLASLSSRINAISFSGHKIGAPAGIGVLVLRPPLAQEYSSFLVGKQEHGLRGGTENLLGATLLSLEAAALSDRLKMKVAFERARNEFEAMILAALPNARIQGHQEPRISNTICLTLKGLGPKIDLVALLDLAGIGVSAGSACQSGTRQPSAVLRAMGIPEEEALQALRVSWPVPPDPADFERFVSVLAQTVAK